MTAVGHRPPAPGASALLVAAVGAGALGALGPALFLAAAPPGLLPGAARGACGWGVAAGPVLALASAWRAAADRELGTAQVRFAAGERWRRQAWRRSGGLARALVATTVAGAAGGGVAAAAAAGRVGTWSFGAGPWPGPTFRAAAVLAPALGMAVGALAALAVGTRRQVATAMAAALVVTVGVLLLRPYAGPAETATPFTPLGAVWPVTFGWSLSRWFAVDLSVERRLLGAAPWLALLAANAARAGRAGPCLRSSAVADRP